MLTATQKLVLEALCDGLVYDYSKHRQVWLRPRRIAVAAGISYDSARRALAQLLSLGLIERLSNEDEDIGTGLHYSPGWSYERGTGYPYPNEWEYEMDTRRRALHRSPYAKRLCKEDERQREKNFHR